MSLQGDENEEGDDRRADAPDRDRNDVARGGEAPDPPVDAERDEEDVPGCEQDRKGGKEDRALELAPEASDHEEVGREEGRADDDEVDDDLDEAAGLEHECLPQRHLRRRVSSARAFLEVAQEAAELHEQDEGEQDAECGQATVVQHVVGESGRADRSRDERQEQDGVRLREPVVDESVRRVVAASLAHRPALPEPDERDERRVQDRDREDQQREEHRGDGRARDGPARRQARTTPARSRAPGSPSRP